MKNQYREGGLPEKGEFGQFTNLRGAWQKRGVHTPMHTMSHLEQMCKSWSNLCNHYQQKKQKCLSN